MSIDYYKVLMVNRNSTCEDVKKSYRRLAMQWHPDKNPNNKKEAQTKFLEISEAYDVLSDPQKKTVYDQNGREEESRGASSSSGWCGSSNNSNNFKFNSRNAADEDVYGKFFCTSGHEGGVKPCKPRKPCTEELYTGSTKKMHTGSTKKMRKPPPVEHKLPCTLEELYTGTTSKKKISREVVDFSGRLFTESETFTIPVQPGWKKGTKIKFANKGNEHPNQLASDLVFVIEEKPHDVYQRDRYDLIVTQKITLAEALGGTTVNLKSLDGRELNIPVTDVVSPGYELVIANEGMPNPKQKGNKGRLRIKFEVNYPTRFSLELKTVLKCALSHHCHSH